MSSRYVSLISLLLTLNIYFPITFSKATTRRNIFNVFTSKLLSGLLRERKYRTKLPLTVLAAPQNIVTVCKRPPSIETGNEGLDLYKCLWGSSLLKANDEDARTTSVRVAVVSLLLTLNRYLLTERFLWIFFLFGCICNFSSRHVNRFC